MSKLPGIYLHRKKLFYIFIPRNGLLHNPLIFDPLRSFFIENPVRYKWLVFGKGCRSDIKSGKTNPVPV